MDGNDVSKRTVMVLLVLTVLVSVVGTWTVLNSLDSDQLGWTAHNPPQSAQISLNVESQQPTGPTADGATGNIALTVNPR